MELNNVWFYYVTGFHGAVHNIFAIFPVDFLLCKAAKSSLCFLLYFLPLSFTDLNIASAVLALLSLSMMVMGSICIAMALSKGEQFFLKPASFCFILSGGTSLPHVTCLYSRWQDDAMTWFYSDLCAGVLVLLSVLIFHQSVLALLSSDHSIPLHHELSWSVACVGSAGALLILGGLLFIILSLPFSPWQKCLPHKNSAT